MFTIWAVAQRKSIAKNFLDFSKFLNFVKLLMNASLNGDLWFAIQQQLVMLELI